MMSTHLTRLVAVVASSAIFTACQGLLESPLIATESSPECLNEVCQTQQQLTAAPRGTPIVFMHGVAGFRTFGDMFDYFYQVVDAFSSEDAPVFATQVAPFQTVAHRATQAAEQIDEVLAHTGARRVHLVCHSQGGLDARYLVSSLGYGDRVASITTIGTPHLGTSVIDAALDTLPGAVRASMGSLVDLLAEYVTAGESAALEQVTEMGTAGAAAFNAANPDDPRVQYYSYAGATQVSMLVDPTSIDIVNPLLLATHQLLLPVEGDNDGLVSIRSATWGRFLGTVPADHWDQIGLLPGSQHPAFDHVAFYRTLAAFLGGNAAPPTY